MGPDIYDTDRRWAGRSSAEFASGLILVAGPATWLGFDPRPIVGVRRLMEINYVRQDWRHRDQLACPTGPSVRLIAIPDGHRRTLVAAHAFHWPRSFR